MGRGQIWGKWELTVHGTGLLFGGNEIFLKLMGVILAQLCKLKTLKTIELCILNG